MAPATLRVALRRDLPRLLVVVIVLTGLRYDVPPADSRDALLSRRLSGLTFNLVNWTLGAASDKIGFELISPQDGLSDAAQVAFVRDFVRLVAETRAAEDEVTRIYLDPAIPDPEAHSVAERAMRDRLRAQLEARRGVAEAILQEQVESVLREEGFALGGQVLPPLRFRMTQLPYVLIVSRRDRIERIDQRELVTGLSVDQADRIERDTERAFDVSAFVTPIGGLGAYPTMLPETDALVFLLATATHEWVHNYLLVRLAPVATGYAEDPVARVINETTATLFERDITPRVLKRFYPDLAWPADGLASLVSDSVAQPAPFDFNREMRITRLRADELLAEGRIEEAEAYMEARRAIFVAAGYGIRRLNQAYFAFYGAYNAEPGGAPTAGRDPIGPAVQALRARSATAGDFLRAIATVRSLADVEAAAPTR
ncbi:MAG: hypothetical protein K1X39_04090 [Thermoflexales bacterium]|nr:hypothetical protein [Thermoflexales bacterium]